MSKLINIGTAESPILVPEAVVSRDGSDRETEWWNALASGSVTVPDKTLDKLLGRSKNIDAKKGE